MIGRKAGDRNAEQPDRLIHREESFQQFGGDKFQLGAAADLACQGPASRDQFEVGELPAGEKDNTADRKVAVGGGAGSVPWREN